MRRCLGILSAAGVKVPAPNAEEIPVRAGERHRRLRADVGSPLPALLRRRDSFQRQRIERAGDPAQVRSRHTQIPGSGLNVRLSEQDLNAAQIRTRFQQVRGAAMSQGVIVVLIISFPLRSAIVITRATQQRSNLFAI